MATDPICGMYVAEKKETLQQEVEGTRYYFCSTNCVNEFVAPQKELDKLKKLILIGIGLIAPIIFLMWVPIFPEQQNHYILFALATPIQFWIGWRFYVGTIDALKHRTTNMDVLIAMGTSAAWGYSTIITFFPEAFPFTKVYFETAAMIILLILIGRLLEHRTKAKASKAIRKLLDLKPRMAHLLKDGKETEIPVEKVKLNDILIVRPGEKIPRCPCHRPQ